MKKTLKDLTDFFAFSQGERRGILALLGILVALMIGIQIMPYCRSEAEELPIAEDLLEASLPRTTDNYRENYRDNYRRNDTSTKGLRTTSQPRYPSQHQSQHPSNARPSHQPRDTSPPKYQPLREKKPFTVQVNACDTLDLQQIRGIGSAFSKRIVKYRDQLGGFVRKEQLLEVWGVDSAKFAQIEGAFVIDLQNIRKLNLNTATIKELQSHPYFDYYQAKAIVQNRENHGPYTDITDILKLALIDRETFDLIREYLEVTN